MGKLMDMLQRQLSYPEYKSDAEECITIYNWLLSNNDGHVWNSQWSPLVNVKFKGFHSDMKFYSLNAIGKATLEGIKNSTTKEITNHNDFCNNHPNCDGGNCHICEECWNSATEHAIKQTNNKQITPCTCDRYGAFHKCSKCGGVIFVQTV